jgi:phospholipase C
MRFSATPIAYVFKILGTLSIAAALLGESGSAVAREDDDGVERIGHIIVIHQENWSFDSLYGLFPGADGLANSFGVIAQADVKASPPYSALIYQTPSPLTGSQAVVDPQFPSANGKLGWQANNSLPLPLIPYDFSDYVDVNVLTGDIIHRFYHKQLQIDNGALEPRIGDLDKFVRWSDNPGLVLSYLDATSLPEGLLAQRFTLCDLEVVENERNRSSIEFGESGPAVNGT